MPEEKKYKPRKTLRTVKKKGGISVRCRPYCSSKYSNGSEEWLRCMEICQGSGGPPETA